MLRHRGPLICTVFVQVAYHSSQVHLRVSRLKAALHRGLRPFLEFRTLCSLEEEIGIATDLFGWCKRDCIDPLLDHDMAGGRKPGDPISQRADEMIERVGGQRSIDPAVPFSQVGVIILRAQHDFKCASTAHETDEMLGAACARDHTKRRLELTKNCGLPRGEAHIARQYELAAHTAYATLDLSDGNEAA